MKYLLAIYVDEGNRTDWDDISPADAAAQMQKWNDYSQAAAAAGKLLGGEGLQPTATATTVRLAGGERVLSDGPFAETKEVLGGYYLLECANLDDALDWAAKIPSLPDGGSVEVRPALVFEGGEDAQPVHEGQASQA
jgi:hypothetical protein